jgi:hypothetical protein
MFTLTFPFWGKGASHERALQTFQSRYSVILQKDRQNHEKTEINLHEMRAGRGREKIPV